MGLQNLRTKTSICLFPVKWLKVWSRSCKCHSVLESQVQTDKVPEVPLVQPSISRGNPFYSVLTRES